MTPSLAAARPVAVPPLASGDRLDAAEFFRRYSMMPEVKKAELVDGVVYMGSPVSHTYHGSPHLVLNTWLGVYVAHTPGVGGSDNATVMLGYDDQPQPDLCLFLPPAAGGRVRVVDDYITGPPEFVAEVAASSASLDRNAKLRAYQRHGVREYLIYRVYDGEVDWLTLDGGAYRPVPPDPGDGLLKSAAFPGLWLDAAALVRGDLAAVLAGLQRGLASAGHAALIGTLSGTIPEGTP